MPKAQTHRNILYFLTDKAVEARREKWAAEVTDEWIAKRRIGSGEHPSEKGFTRKQLIQLADIAEIADDVFRKDLSSKNVGPEMGFVVSAMYLDFGYTVGFIHHVREYSAKGFGFAGDRERPKFFRKKIDGRFASLNATVALRFLRNPYFVSALKKAQRRPTIKDAVNLIEKTGRYRAVADFDKELGKAIRALSVRDGREKRRHKPPVEV